MAELLRSVNITCYLFVPISGSGNTANVSICCSPKQTHKIMCCLHLSLKVNQSWKADNLVVVAAWLLCWFTGFETIQGFAAFTNTGLTCPPETVLSSKLVQICLPKWWRGSVFGPWNTLAFFLLWINFIIKTLDVSLVLSLNCMYVDS